MKKREKKVFVRSLIKNVQAGILAKSKEWPPEWDGIELRYLVSDHFQRATFRTTRSRKRAYNNEIMVKNLV